MKVLFKVKINHLFLVLLVAGLAYLTISCDQQPTALAENPVPSAPVLPTETATVVWFPATSTPTPLPPPQPTSTTVVLSGIGEVVSIDQFTDPEAWVNTQLQGGNSPNRSILSDSTLVFAINQPPARLTTFNQKVLLADAAISITFTVNRCTAGDVYGVLFNTQNEKYGNRLTMNCDGRFRVEQLRENLTLPLTEWVASGDVPVGSPGVVKVTIWTAGVETRVFLNDHFQASIIDSYYRNGSFGFFVSATNEAGLNIKVSDLSVNQVNFLSPTPDPAKNVTLTQTPSP